MGVDRESSDLETIDLDGGTDAPRVRPRRFANRRSTLAFVAAVAVVAAVVLSLAIRVPHHRRHPAGTATTPTSVSPSPNGPTTPVRSNEPILGRFYPLLDRTDKATIVLPTGLSVTLSGGVSTAIGGLGATFFGTVTPTNTSACCALSFFVEHAAPSDLFARLGPSAIAAPVLVPAANAVQPDLGQVRGRVGILSTGDWTLIASFENGDHSTVADAIVLELLGSWRIRSTPNGAVLDVPSNSVLGNIEAEFGRTPDLTDEEINLIPTRLCTGERPQRTIGTSYSATRRVGTWCERGLRVNVEGPRPYVQRVVEHLEINVEPVENVAAATFTGR